MKTLANQTIAFIDSAFGVLEEAQALPQGLRRYAYRPWQFRPHQRDLQTARNIILELEAAAKRTSEDVRPAEIDVHAASRRYPVFRDVVRTIPVFTHALALECHRPLVRPSEIPTLLYLIKIPSCGEGVDVETHGFGYHFHYGKVKGEALRRTDVLFTFDPVAPAVKRSRSATRLGPPLLAEYHAEGKNKSIDIANIGSNKREPIYSVCLLAGEKRGFSNFKRPKAEATVFHAGDIAA